MDDSGDLSDWELLSQDSPTHFNQQSIAINHDYFTLDSINMVVSGDSSEMLDVGKVEGRDDGGCWEEMNLDVGFDQSDGLCGKDFDLVGEFEENETGGEGFGGNDDELDLGSRGIEEKQQNSAGESEASEGIEGNGIGGEFFVEDDGNLDMGFRGIDAEQQKSAADRGLEGNGGDSGFRQIEGESVGEGKPLVVEPMRMEDRTLEEESSEVVGGDSAIGDGFSGCEGEKKMSVLLKMPLDLLKLCVLKVRPVWSISIAVGIIGILMLGRRLYKMKGKRRGLPRKISLDDKKNSRLVLHASRLNEGLSAVRRVPFVRLPPPAGSVSLWPVGGSLRALDW